MIASILLATALTAAQLPVIPSVREWKSTGEGVCAAPQQVTTRLDKDAFKGAEDYRLEIAPMHVTLTAQSAAGLRHAQATLAQMMDALDGKLPLGVVTDGPKYRVRGVMLDAARKWYSLAFLDQLVDVLAYYKFNELHIHLNDNGPGTNCAFRLECATYPGLESAQHYTKAEFRDFVKRAAAKGVNIVPEIDVPAHSAVFSKYRPSLGSKKFGPSHLDLHNPELLPFLKALFAEYCCGADPVFAGPNVSVGTDEYRKEEAEAFRAFTDAMLKMVKGFGKVPRAWGALTHAAGQTPVDPSGATLDIWHNGYYQPLEAIKAGFNVICVPDNLVYIVPSAHYYYDHLNYERLFRIWEPCYFEEVYVPSAHPQLAGGKFALWNDYGEEGVDEQGTYERLFPAIQTLGEKMWAGKREGLTWDDFTHRAAQTREAPTVQRLERAAGLYRVYDLATGTLQELDSAPAMGWSDNDCTNRLVMKRIRKGLFAAVYETTQGQWAHFNDDNPSMQSHAPMAAVDHVSYVFAKAWTTALSARMKGAQFDVPTYAEWKELAAQKGKGIEGLGNGYTEWVSDQDANDARVRYCVDGVMELDPNYESSLSGNDRETFRVILRD